MKNTIQKTKNKTSDTILKTSFDKPFTHYRCEIDLQIIKENKKSELIKALIDTGSSSSIATSSIFLPNQIKKNQYKIDWINSTDFFTIDS